MGWVRSYRTFSSLLRIKRGGISLLHLSWGHPRRALPVILALWSPDFPHLGPFGSHPRLSAPVADLLYFMGRKKSNVLQILFREDILYGTYWFRAVIWNLPAGRAAKSCARYVWSFLPCAARYRRQRRKRVVRKICVVVFALRRSVSFYGSINWNLQGWRRSRPRPPHL